jgi:hypothetical protein
MEGGECLTVTISVAVLLTGTVVVLCRYTGLRIWQAVICMACGFVLASSSLAPDISQFMTSLFRQL